MFKKTAKHDFGQLVALVIELVEATTSVARAAAVEKLKAWADAQK